MSLNHAHLLTICRRLPTDYTDYGGTVVRWEDGNPSYPDCSCGCKWAVRLEPPFSADWCVCGRADAPRRGLLTFEHLAGKGCFETDEPPDPDGILWGGHCPPRG